MTIIKVKDQGRWLATINPATGEFIRLTTHIGAAAAPLTDLETWTKDGQYLFASGNGQKLAKVADMQEVDWYMLSQMLLLDLEVVSA